MKMDCYFSVVIWQWLFQLVDVGKAFKAAPDVKK